MRQLYKKEKICVWGVGYIGFTTMVHFLKEGIDVIGYDTDEFTEEKLRNHKKIINLEFWLGFDYSYILNTEKFLITNDIAIIKHENPEIHFICVPTELKGDPWDGALFETVDKIIDIEKCRKSKKVCILIESTMTPGTGKKILKLLESKLPKKEIFFAVSPRRDWFLSGDKNLKNLVRVVGTNSDVSAEYFKGILSIICENMVFASDYQHAEIVKSIENAYRHMDITLANQLSSAFPDYNIREVLQLVGTKWNANTFYPSFGTGGYCIPLSSKYLLNACDPDLLTLLNNTVKFDDNRPLEICQIIEKKHAKKIAFLGISYKENIKVDKQSPALKMINYFSKISKEIYVNDVLYEESEIDIDCKFKFFDCYDYETYKEFDALVICTAHREYKILKKDKLFANLLGCKIIIDNVGLWYGYYEELNRLTDYRVVGVNGWNK